MRVFFFIACCLLLTSCFDKGDCLFSNTDILKVNFMDATAPKTQKSVAIDSVFIPNKGYFLGAGTVNGVLLVLDPRETSETFVFQYGGRSDTLVLSYTTQHIVLSPDCGTYPFQKGLTIEHNTFGSSNVVLKDPNLLTTVAVNLEILF